VTNLCPNLMEHRVEGAAPRGCLADKTLPACPKTRPIRRHPRKRHSGSGSGLSACLQLAALPHLGSSHVVAEEGAARGVRVVVQGATTRAALLQDLRLADASGRVHDDDGRIWWHTLVGGQREAPAARHATLQVCEESKLRGRRVPAQPRLRRLRNTNASRQGFDGAGSEGRQSRCHPTPGSRSMRSPRLGIIGSVTVFSHGKSARSNTPRGHRQSVSDTFPKALGPTHAHGATVS
jgi:hypothetical protein